MEPGDFAVSAGRKIKSGAVAGANELSGHQKNLLTQGLEGSVLELRWQTEALEPVDQIVGE